MEDRAHRRGRSAHTGRPWTTARGERWPLRRPALACRWARAARGFVRHQVVSGRWVRRTHNVLSTTTGPLSWEQRLWLGVLHAGPDALVGGLTAATSHGLRGGDRESPSRASCRTTCPSTRSRACTFFRTPRNLAVLRSPRVLPTCRLEPAVLLFAGYERHRRTAHGAVGVRPTAADDRRAPGALARGPPTAPWRKGFRTLVGDLAGGAQSVAEIDVRRACHRFGVCLPDRQRLRRDRDGLRRWTDCEWDLPGGRVLVLEVDGGFHREVLTYAADMKRQRKLTTADRLVIRWAAEELPTRSRVGHGRPARARSAPGRSTG